MRAGIRPANLTETMEDDLFIEGILEEMGVPATARLCKHHYGEIREKAKQHALHQLAKPENKAARDYFAA